MLAIKNVISNGVAYGKCVSIIHSNKTYDIYSSNNVEEINKFDLAIAKSLAELDDIKKELSSSDSEFVEIHRMLISDPVLRSQVVESIDRNHLTAISAFNKAVDNYIEQFRNARTTYLAERALDMEDIKRRVVANLEDDEKINVSGSFILVTDELYPSYLMTYSKQIIGVIALKGGFTSHSAILCKSREIPYVVIDDLSGISGNVMIDTRKGVIKLNPSDEEIKEYEKSIADKNSFEVNDFSSFGIKILANVSANIDLDKVIKYKMNGVGLYRTELIFMNLDKPMSFDEQYNIYKDATDTLKDRPITFRTFDIGDDKQLSYIKSYHKGIDNYKNNPEVFETQIRALISANKYNNMKIMFPMIETNEEFLYLKDWVLRIKKDMNDDSVLKIGMMLETKQAVETITSFKDVDFMSLGTNDLTKELYNISREEALNYTDFIKDLLKRLEAVVEHCKKEEVELSICGELASVKAVVKRLYRAGIKSFSVSSAGVKNLNDALMEEIEE